jgi:hypothetical protein
MSNDSTLPDGERVSVPVVGPRWLHGAITGQEWDAVLGEQVWIVQFPSGNTARLTESEIIRS